MKQCEACGKKIKGNATRRYCNAKCWWKNNKHRPEVKEARKRYYEANRASILERSRKWANANVKRRRKNYRRYQTGLYGITEAIYKRLSREQKLKCLICKLKKRPLVIDHCHSTNKVRGLLCRSCNQALGLMKDKPKLLKAASKYLERTPPRWLQKQ